MSRVSATPVDGTETTVAAFTTTDVTGLGVIAFGVTALGVTESGGRVTPATIEPSAPITAGAVKRAGEISVDHETAPAESAVAIGVLESSGRTAIVGAGNAESTVRSEPTAAVLPVLEVLAVLAMLPVLPVLPGTIDVEIDVEIGGLVGSAGWTVLEEQEEAKPATAITKAKRCERFTSVIQGNQVARRARHHR